MRTATEGIAKNSPVEWLLEGILLLAFLSFSVYPSSLSSFHSEFARTELKFTENARAKKTVAYGAVETVSPYLSIASFVRDGEVIFRLLQYETSIHSEYQLICKIQRGFRKPVRSPIMYFADNTEAFEQHSSRG